VGRGDAITAVVPLLIPGSGHDGAARLKCEALAPGPYRTLAPFCLEGPQARPCADTPLADVLDQHRTAALQPSITNSDSETDEENVPSTLQQSA
jgi:hypothetical protein